MPGETLITDAAPAAAPAAGTPAAATPAGEAGTPPASQAGSAGASAADAATAGAAGAGDDKGNEPGEKTPEQKAADEAAAKDTDEAAAKAAGAPEKYEAFVAPEGTALAPAVITKFEETARALNLPQDKAQQLINEMAPVMAQQQQAQVEQLRADWAAASTADKEFGGEKLAENLGFARKAIDTFGSPELRTMLNETGLGNHPDVVRFMVRAGKALGEDKILTGGAPASANRSAAEVLYGSTPAKK